MLLIVLSFLFACQEKEEPLTCEFEGHIYSVGEWFNSSDGCNSCSCDGYEGETLISCTEMDCSTIEEVDCVDLSITDCETTERCAVITASEVALNTDEECFEWANSVENVGCMDADMNCDAALTIASSSEDPTMCYGFSNTCTPEGWSDCHQESFPSCE
jgi:hypothetical protein